MSEETHADEEDLAEGTLLSHLIELRGRLVKMAAAVIVPFALMIPWAKHIYDFVSAPLLGATETGQMLATTAAGPLLAPFKLTFLVALFVAMPLILYQLWAFVAPGLYRKEKRFAFPLVASSVLLFYAGVAFAYYVVFPLVFGFFGSISLEGVEYSPDISAYLDFVTSIVLAFGIAFEVPIATVLVVWAGLTTPEKLGKARPYVFLMAFVVGMFLTPPDVISQTLLAIPVYFLYECGIIMSRLFTKKPKVPETVET